MGLSLVCSAQISRTFKSHDQFSASLEVIWQPSSSGSEGEGTNLNNTGIECSATLTFRPYRTETLAKQSYSLSALPR